MFLKGSRWFVKKLKQNKNRYPTAPVPVVHNEEVTSSLFLILSAKKRLLGQPSAPH